MLQMSFIAEIFTWYLTGVSFKSTYINFPPNWLAKLLLQTNISLVDITNHLRDKEWQVSSIVRGKLSDNKFPRVIP